MSKTPVSLLQELAMKNSISLAYEELPPIQERLRFIFVIKVKCKKYEVEGRALTKKEAKHNAAEKMLIKLQNENLISKVSLSNMKTNNESPNSSPNKSIIFSSALTSAKNYVGLLGEYCQAHGLPLPDYTESPMGTRQEGTQTIFAIKVRCGSYEAESKARTKKEAKQNVAEIMLAKLTDNNVTTKHALENSSKESNDCDSSLNNTLDSSFSTQQSLSNYVGLLQEYCQEKGLPFPNYQSISGSINSSAFVISCSVGKICLEGSASTKKRAKQLASEKVFNSIQNDPSLKLLLDKKDMNLSNPETIDIIEKLGFEIENLRIMDDKNMTTSEIKLIESKFNKIKKKTHIDLRLMGDQHHKISKLIDGMSEMQKDHILLLHSKGTSTNKLTIEHAISTALKVKKIEKFVMSSKTGNIFIAGCKLGTDPPIVHIGMGITIEKAELDALNKTLKLIVFYINAC